MATPVVNDWLACSYVISHIVQAHRSPLVRSKINGTLFFLEKNDFVSHSAREHERLRHIVFLLEITISENHED